MDPFVASQFAISFLLVSIACLVFCGVIYFAVWMWKNVGNQNAWIEECNNDKAEKALKKIAEMTKNHDTVAGIASVTADRLSEALEEWNPNWHGWNDKK